MRIATYQVFDQTISGTTTWFSGSEFNALLAQADFAAIMAYPTSVPNATTQLIVTFQTSADSQNWITVNTAQAIGTPVSVTLSEGVPVAGASTGGSSGADIFGGFVRLAISLSGTNPSCRLKLYYTARARGLKA